MKIKLPIPEPENGFGGLLMEYVLRWIITNLKVIWATSVFQLLFDVFVVIALLVLFLFFH